MGEVIRLDVWTGTATSTSQAEEELQQWTSVPPIQPAVRPVAPRISHPWLVRAATWVCTRILGLLKGRTLVVPGLSDELAGRLERLGAARGASIETIVLESLEASLSADLRRRRLARHATLAASDRCHFAQAIACQRGIDDELWG